MIDRRRHYPSAVGRRLIRLLNLLVAAVGIVVTAPLMLLIGVVVALTSRGPILYRQQRVGRDRRQYSGPGTENGKRSDNTGGQLFTMYKFRSMTYRPQPGPAREVWARPQDPRITATGSLLRKHRLDELPQLFNVLRGDMNVVGPRPEQPALFRELREQVDGYARRQSVLPGITGWAQVNHPYDRSLDDVKKKVALDLEYLRDRSPIEDLRIMARTVPVMVGKRGAL
jgi:lipopolysaccharide/colanic/teichoic acid biosynthesis glycosyltransferase